MKHFKHLLVFVILCPLISFAQNIPSEKEPFSLADKIFWGGNFSIQFGTITLVDASPLIGYKITDKLVAGVGGTYIYYRYQDRTYNFTTDVYGGRVFGRYYILENLFAHGEYEILNLERFDFADRRINIESILVGGGYRMEAGPNSFFSIMGLWNLNDSYYSPYMNPIIRVGFTVGL